MQYIAEHFREYEQESLVRIAQYDRLKVLHDSDEWGLEALSQRPCMVQRNREILISK